MTAYRRNNTSFITSIYDGVHDVVRFDNNKARCSYDNMYDLLDLEFPKEGFNPYLQSVIEGSELLIYTIMMMIKRLKNLNLLQRRKD